MEIPVPLGTDPASPGCQFPQQRRHGQQTSAPGQNGALLRFVLHRPQLNQPLHALALYRYPVGLAPVLKISERSALGWEGMEPVVGKAWPGSEPGYCYSSLPLPSGAAPGDLACAFASA